MLLALLPVVSDAALNVAFVRKGEGATIERWKRDRKSLTLAFVCDVPLEKEVEGSGTSCLNDDDDGPPPDAACCA